MNLEEIRDRILAEGFFAKLDDNDATVLHCYQRVPGKNTGTAFRLALNATEWELLSWGYLKWRIPSTTSPVEVALAWLRIADHLVVPPKELREEFSLISVPWDYPPGVLEQYAQARKKREERRGGPS